MDPNSQQPDPQIAAIVKALAMTENGGKVPAEAKAGQSGEMKSIFQYTPGTWKMYAKQILGKEVPLDRNTETIVTYGKVHQMIQQGLSPQEIASVWNSGKPDAYLHEHKGINKYGVQYDTPGYVNKFDKYLKEVSGGNSGGGAPSENQPSMASAMPQTQPSMPARKPVGPIAVSDSNTLPSLMQRNMKQVRSV